MLRRLLMTCALPLCAACPSNGSGGGQENQNQPSPNASILPAPLASGAELKAAKTDAGRGGIPADSAGRLIVPEAGPPEPTAMREDEALPRDTLSAKDGTGVTLEARFKWLDVPGPNSVPELSNDALKKAREKTALNVTVDLAPAGRMRFVFASASFPVPSGAELRAQTERYGHVLVWPDGNLYRILGAGTLRALLSERRADALPLARAKPVSKGKGNYLGLETSKLQVSTPVGDISLELAPVLNVGRSGELLCRLLLDLVAIDPAAKICADGLTPLRAEMRWPQGGKLAFDVGAILRKPELPFGFLFVPPAGASFRPGELPPQAAGVLFSRDELAAFHTKPMAGEVEKDAPGEGLLAVNRTDSVRYVLLDGVPVAWIQPKSEQFLIGPLPGRYSVSFRDFLGGAIEPARVVQLPARISVGAEDAGTPAP
ncbi:MAG: hypothetical protein IPI67_00670 [Myxococcales bacterium]|nr:hypothetical protein [Myxococcales bacterium]